MVFLWIIFELLYCYNIGLEIFLGSIFYTFFWGTPPPPRTKVPLKWPQMGAMAQSPLNRKK